VHSCVDAAFCWLPAPRGVTTRTRRMSQSTSSSPSLSCGLMVTCHSPAMAQQLYQTLLNKSITVGCKELEDQKLSYRDLKTWLIRHYGADSTVTALYLHSNFQLQQPKPDPPCSTSNGSSRLSTSNFTVPAPGEQESWDAKTQEAPGNIPKCSLPFAKLISNKLIDKITN
jgi:hypothetical protein